MWAWLVGLAWAADAARLVLVGDGGAPTPAYLEDCRAPCADPLLVEVARAVSGPTRVVWLGDNVYEAGVSAHPSPEVVAVLARQAAVGTPDQVRFIAGNHDWAQSVRGGRRWPREAALVRGSARAVAAPVERESFGPLELVYVDSLRAIQRPADADAVLAALAEIPAERPLVLLMHHPVESTNRHGRRKWYDFAIDTELHHPRYARWRRAVTAWIAARPGPVVVASGHDHGLELVDGPVVQIVSGAASKANGAPPAPSDAVVHRPGFVVVDAVDGRLAVQVVYLRTDEAPGCMPVMDGWWACRPPARAVTLDGRAAWSAE
jgi:hypothetical protein